MLVEKNWLSKLKTLKLFTYYCASFGVDSVYRQYYLQDCRHDWDEGNWSSPQTRVNIESYDKIDELIDKLINDDSLISNFTEKLYNYEYRNSNGWARNKI